MIGFQNVYTQGTSLEVQQLRLCASIAGDFGSIPDWGTRPLYPGWSPKTFTSKCVSVQSCLFLTSLTVASQATLSIEFSRQEYWSG